MLVGAIISETPGPTREGEVVALFAVMLTYIEDKDRIAQIRPAHRKHLTSQFEAGRLYHAGPFTDDTGGMAIYTADSEEDVRRILADDPFTIHGIITEAKVKEWEIVYNAAGATS
jgi:uncharacterized protein YciI